MIYTLCNGLNVYTVLTNKCETKLAYNSVINETYRQTSKTTFA